MLNNQITQSKICTKCEVLKTLDLFPKSKSCKDGRRGYCKQCDTIGKRKYYNPIKEKERRVLRAEYNKKYLAKYQIENKQRIKELAKKWALNNRDRINENARRYCQENKEKVRAVRALWVLKNKDKLEAKKQTIEYKTIKRMRKQIRRSKEKNTDITAPYQRDLLKKAVKCYWCEKSFSKTNFKTIDHYIPIYLGGLHMKDNIVVACRSCNGSKQAKAPEDFAYSKGKLF